MWQVLVAEFSDVPDAAEATRLVVRLVAASLMAAVIGFDRQRNESPAGIRTHVLVALGSALLVIAPQHAGFGNDDMSRVVQGLVAGIGFLGAGTILKQDESFRVRGLTTAASIWLTAAIGITVGLGQLVTALVATVFGLLVLNVHTRDRGARTDASAMRREE